jgi:hypothetical protein
VVIRLTKKIRVEIKAMEAVYAANAIANEAKNGVQNTLVI